MTTSHLTNPVKDAGQVIDETTSHLTNSASCQVIGYGYSHSTKLPKTPTKWLVMPCVKNLLLAYTSYAAPQSEVSV
jgi:hypothetical protein